MKKFEYKIIIIEAEPLGFWPSGLFDEDEFASLLKTQGEEGWELVQYFPCKGLKTHKYLFGFIGITPAALRLVFKREIE